MLQNYKLSLKKLNEKKFSLHCFIFILFIKDCFCTIHVNVHSSIDEKQKVTFVDSEELIRRRSLIENYLKEKGNPENDWIETYHGIYSGKSVVSKKTKEESFQNMDSSSFKNTEDTNVLHESLSSEKNSVEKQTQVIELGKFKKTDKLNNSQKKCFQSYNFSDSKSQLKRVSKPTPISNNFNDNENFQTKNLKDSKNFKFRIESLKKTDELNDNQKNWIETYHSIYSKRNFVSSPISDSFKNYYNLQTCAKHNIEFRKSYSQERLYIIRWINQLQKKIKNSNSNYHSLSILISDNLHKLLEELSREFDIVTLDKLVNNMISNAKFHNTFESAFYFDYKQAFKYIYLSMQNNVIYILIAALLIISLYNILAKTKINSNFVLPLKWILISTILIVTFSWNAHRMYQLKIAERHTVMSRVVPSYCENILRRESGIYAHFKEFFRQLWHDEDCKKYYEAVMVDPVAEITFLSISTDLLSDMFQILQPFGRHMNTFYKELTHGLYFPSKILVMMFSFFVLIVILYFSVSLFLSLFCKYRINFPFHLGSAEPTEFSVGSRVEEVEDNENSSKDLCVTCNKSLVNYENKKHVESVNLKINCYKIESKLELPKYCDNKASRTRRLSI